eukprot:CAMPEP_0201535496 /NCGR_PEP_ID=MMETSP0161_2-20130828/59206_1 /ASSEMBLY_ACC=CAM_ASM_000251 /TAXON_ID=180227 /ORGANISM="Neoparamoeba aestuarina, Strain SoJaBio B1-5/56/2" /LENGTH=812 /DNA_ID=CAMNT_0047940717 /DNA_START=126 /DNA_END=2560 /DNA_ORIENTATION=+
MAAEKCPVDKIFLKLEKIDKEHLKIVHQDKEKKKTVRNNSQCLEMYADFFDSLASILPIFVKEPPATGTNFSAIFHQRMLSASSPMTPTQFECYKAVLKKYKEVLGEHIRSHDEDQREAISLQFEKPLEMMNSLLDFLETHEQDPDGAILGLSPSDRVLKEYKSIFERLISRRKETQEILPISPRKKFDLVLTAKHRNAKSFQPPLNCLSISHPRRKDVVNAITQLNNLSRKEMYEQILSFGKLFETELKLTEIWKNVELRPGDLVMVVLFDEQLMSVKKANQSRVNILQKRAESVGGSEKTEVEWEGEEIVPGSENDPWLHLRGGMPIVFCRFLFASSSSVYVLTNADEKESETLQVAWWQVAPLSEGAQSMLDKNRKSMVRCPVDTLYKSLTNYVKDKTFAYLQSEHQIEQDLIVRIIGNETTITDLTKLKHAYKEIEELIKTKNDSYKQFLKSIGEHTTTTIQNFRKTFAITEIFAPGRQNSLKSVEMEDFAGFTESRIVRYLGMCEFALGKLELDKKFLMSGSQKEKMTEWWLTTIEGSVEKFLNSKGFVEDVIPMNYIDEPPTDFEALKKNLKLLQEIMNPKEDIHGTQEFVADLKNAIYPRIHSFLSNGRIALCEQFGQKEEDFNLEMITRVFEEQRASLGPKIEKWIDGTIKDMEYLEAIIEAEENPKQGGGLELGPVPISGLIVGYFYRLENEHTTVLDVWRHLDKDFQQKQQQQQQQEEDKENEGEQQELDPSEYSHEDSTSEPEDGKGTEKTGEGATTEGDDAKVSEGDGSAPPSSPPRSPSPSAPSCPSNPEEEKEGEGKG